MQNYNVIQKILHDLCFKFKIINNSLYEIEKLIYFRNINPIDIKHQKHIFISGLPRSGTTTLLNYIYQNDEFASLKYKNMPFIFSVNLTSKINIQKNFKPKLRPHNDKIFFSLDSPEAFDEVFLNSINHEKSEEEFIKYVSLILKYYKKKKYLSKNNNNCKRIDFLKKTFPNAKFLIPFRNPLQQSLSLMNQDINFLKIHSNDKFVLRYMNFLGHNEFGINHKPWFKPKLYYNRNDINYWIEQWLEFYSYYFNLYNEEKQNCKFVCYEKLIDSSYQEELSKFLETNLFNKKQFDISFKPYPKKYDNDLFQTAIELYEKINNLA